MEYNPRNRGLAYRVRIMLSFPCMDGISLQCPIKLGFRTLDPHIRHSTQGAAMVDDTALLGKPRDSQASQKKKKKKKNITKKKKKI